MHLRVFTIVFTSGTQIPARIEIYFREFHDLNESGLRHAWLTRNQTLAKR